MTGYTQDHIEICDTRPSDADLARQVARQKADYQELRRRVTTLIGRPKERAKP